MEPDDYHQTCDDLYGQILGRMERRGEGMLEFATRGTSSQVLRDDQLRRFMRSLNLCRPPFIEAHFAEKVKERELHDFIATLILTSCTAKAARTFVINLTAAPIQPMRDSSVEATGRLPVSTDQLKELFGNENDAHKFSTKQAYFCAFVIREGEEVCVKDDGFQRQPYLQQQFLNQGSFGKVYSVVIAPGHFQNRGPDTASRFNTEPKRLARKDYILDKSAKDEYKVMKKILDSSTHECKNIVVSLGCLQIGSTYSLFMPLAICDLRHYIMVAHQAKPQSRKDREDIIRCTIGLASGLRFLHEGMKSPDYEQVVCYHLDLKPSNILIFHEYKDNQQQKVWKLSDFGMSRVKIRPDVFGANPTERDFNRSFLRRDKTRDPSASATLNKRGEGTYLAPESIPNTPSMQTSSDVWSLGCVASVIFTYLEEGSEGVERYSDRRAETRHADNNDRFFLRSSFVNPLKVHPLVKPWHTELIDKATKRDPQEGKAVSFVLRNLESNVLQIECKDRCRAKDVEVILEKAYQMYRGLGGDGRASADNRPTEPSNRLARYYRRLMSPPSPPDTGVRAWPLAPVDAIKGSVISPDAAVVVYWTNTKILLYTSHSLHQSGDQKRLPSAEFILPDPGSLWKSVCVSKKRLIACTTGSNDWYLFDFYGPQIVDANLNQVEKKVLMQVPVVYRLAISPDGSKLACVAQNKEEGREPGTLYYAAVSDLFRAGQDQEPEPNRGWKRKPLKWRAKDVIHLSVSDVNDVHLVFGLQRTTRGAGYRLPIVRESLRTGTGYTLEVKPGPEGSNTRFFTTLCNFRHEEMCALVTQERRLHILKISGDRSRDIRRDIRDYRIRRLLIGHRHGDRKLYALGCKTTSHRMLLLEIIITPVEAELVVRQLGQLPNLSYSDDFSQMVSDEGEDKYILVAALTPTIYGVAIS
ncbi:hypothetical protein CP532_5986 [Ophiocordyceps camponoti-leonardi (nom. inval.)]|nr:hypothetical protein CP532_5986 [Ophiocordyceps camponoti-leonardi (nom. inval.)]